MRSLVVAVSVSFALVATAYPAASSVFDVRIDGTDAIFLAGRTDLTIPDPSVAWGDNDPATFDGMLRHPGNTPEEAQETLPPFITVAGGDEIKVLDPAIGGIDFFNGVGLNFFGPEGAGSTASSSITSFAGISGYKGTQGALTGVFLNDDIPNGTSSPATLDFNVIGRNFATLSPELGQVFFIGDGKTDGGTFQSFIAPTGATRLFLGVPDGFSFNGVPGAYDDNDGFYRIVVGVNATPTVSAIPLPAPALLLLTGVLALVGVRKLSR